MCLPAIVERIEALETVNNKALEHIDELMERLSLQEEHIEELYNRFGTQQQQIDRLADYVLKIIEFLKAR